LENINSSKNIATPFHEIDCQQTPSVDQISGKTDIDGLEFDFNYGARIKVPEGNWRVKIFDRDTAVTMHDVQTSNNMITSTKKYYINFRLEVYQDDNLVFEHNMDLKGKKVLLNILEH